MTPTRIRLRAPDEGETPAPTTRPPSTQASPRTPLRLPQLDVRSPEFIEQRLENLKRKQNWLTYLDQYVKDHPEDDDDAADGGGKDESATTEEADGDDDDDDEESAEDDDGVGFLASFVYAAGVMALTPAWIVLFPVVQHKGPEFWPLGSPSLWALYRQSLALLLFIALGLVLMYYTVCREVPEWSRDTWYVLQVELEDLLDATKSCRAAVSRGDDVLTRELCAPIAIDIVVLLLTMWAISKTHKKWGKVLLVVMSGLLFTDIPGKINQALQPLPEVYGIDQPYALVDEEILVAFDGKNLQPGGTIAWVSYWGCASTSPVDTCDRQFPATFDLGYAAVTFTTIDHFIPCYRNPHNPLKAEEFRCFEKIRLPVKDKRSIPGWSKGASSASRLTGPTRKLDDSMPSSSERKHHRSGKKPKSVSVDAATGNAHVRDDGDPRSRDY